MCAQNLLAQSSKEFMIGKKKNNYMISFSFLENVFEIKGGGTKFINPWSKSHVWLDFLNMFFFSSTIHGHPTFAKMKWKKKFFK